jgi:sugar lactone lactonase YvrE
MRTNRAFGVFAVSGGVVCGLIGAAASLLGTSAPAMAGPPSQPEQPSVLLNFDPALGQLPESITADGNGNIYASNVNGEIQHIDPATQSFTTVATVPLAAGGNLTGIKVGPDGNIYVCQDSFTPTAATIWKVSPQTGDVSLFASLNPNGFPNDIAFQDDGSMLVTDPFLALIYKIDTSGNATIWLSDPLFAGNPAAPTFGVHDFGVDGIAFDSNKKNLFVGNVDFGRVIQIPVTDGVPGTLQVLAEDSRLIGIDGIAIDRRGTVFAAVDTQDSLATVDKQGNVSVIAQGPPLQNPSSFAFGTGQDDKKTLYVTNFAIVRVLTGQPASPGILTLPAQVPGLPLP